MANSIKADSGDIIPMINDKGNFYYLSTFENKLNEIWFKNDHLYVRIKNLNLDIKLGNENKIIDKLKMLKGFYAYTTKK